MQPGQDRIGERRGIDGRGFPAGAVQNGADVTLHQFAGALQDGFLGRVSGGGAVELVELFEPAERNHVLPAGIQVRGRGEPPGHQVEDADGFRFGHGIPHGPDQPFHGQKPVAESGLSLAPGHVPEIFVRIPEAEIAVSLDQFHEGRGLGLGGRSAFSHLLAGGHDGSGVFAADGHEYRDAQPPGVDAAGLGENAQTGIFKSRSGMGDGFFWGTGLVQIRDGTFGTGADGDHAGPDGKARAALGLENGWPPFGGPWRGSQWPEPVPAGIRARRGNGRVTRDCNRRVRLTREWREYIKLSRYCDETRKAVQIRRGRATVTGGKTSRSHCLRIAGGKARRHGPEARRRLVTMAAMGAARQYVSRKGNARTFG